MRWDRARLIAGVTVALLAAAPGVVAAPGISQSCLARAALTSYLERAFGEARVAVGELDNGHRVEIFASRQGSWTLVEFMPDGQGCINAHGTRMRVEKLNLKQQPAS